MIEGIHHAQVTIPAGAEAEALARAYYCDLLGLTEAPKPESLAGRGGMWLQLAGSQVHLGVQEGVDRRASKAHVAYAVADLEAIREALSSQGYTCEEGTPIPGYARFESRDPFGNRVEFIQRLP